MRIPGNISYFGTACSLLISNYLFAAFGGIGFDTAAERSFFQIAAVFIIMQHVEKMELSEIFG